MLHRTGPGIAQHVGDLELQVKGLLVVGPELADPQFLQPPRQGQAGLELAELPLVAHPVDEQLTGPWVIALLGLGRAKMRPDHVVGGPVRGIVGLALAGPGAGQDLVHLMPGLAPVLCLVIWERITAWTSRWIWSELLP